MIFADLLLAEAQSCLWINYLTHLDLVNIGVLPNGELQAVEIFLPICSTLQWMKQL